jgi:hypothetical protein
MNLIITRQMIAAEILKLRRRRRTMATATCLTVGIAILYFAAIELRHHGNLGGARGLSDGASLMGTYFGSFAAILIGTEAATNDLANGMFGDLVATGRSRIALFLARIPAAIIVALAFTLTGFIIAVVAAVAFRGVAPSPAIGLTLQSAGWVALATTVLTTLAVGVGSLTGSRSLTLTAVIGWETIASTLLYDVHFLGSARDAVLLMALDRLRPGIAYGSYAHPGSSNALPGYELPMAATVAILVLLTWMLIPTVAGARRTAIQDA